MAQKNFGLMKHQPTIFKEPSLNEQMTREGYVVVPFLQPEKVELLTKIFFAHHATLPEGMYSTSHSPDFTLRKKMNETIQRACAEAIEATFQNYSALGSTFMAKTKGNSGSLKPHQDWSIVDENEYCSYNIWLPLVDVSEKNGTLQILPRSHSFLQNIRGLNIPSSYESVLNEVEKMLVPLRVSSGEAVVYDHRLVHASGINQTDEVRLTIVYGIVPQAADMRYYFGNKGKIEVYECSPEFYFSQQINDGPHGLKLIEILENNNPVVSKKDLDYFLAPGTKNWWQRIWKWS
jgi:hypothetical protein